MRVVALTSGRNVPSSRFRVRQFIAPLRALGIDIDERCPPFNKYATPPALWTRLIDPKLPRAESVGGVRIRRLGRAVAPAARLLMCASRLPDVMASRSANLVWLEREMVAGRSTLERWTGRPRLFDVDDALWLNGSTGFSDRIVRDCDGVLAGNEFLAAHYRGIGARVWVVPTAVDTDVWTPRPEEVREGWTIGWIGTSSNLPYLLPYEDALARFLHRRSEARLLVVSDRRPLFTRLPPNHWQFVPWSATSEVAQVQRMDVGLMPLPDTDWARGKCSFKMLQYMAASIPVVVSPVGTNLEVLARGEVGLPARDPEELEAALDTLFLDRERAIRMGQEGRRVVETGFSLRRVAPQLAAIFREVTNPER